MKRVIVTCAGVALAFFVYGEELKQEKAEVPSFVENSETNKKEIVSNKEQKAEVSEQSKSLEQSLAPQKKLADDLEKNFAKIPVEEKVMDRLSAGINEISEVAESNLTQKYENNKSDGNNLPKKAEDLKQEDQKSTLTDQASVKIEDSKHDNKQVASATEKVSANIERRIDKSEEINPKTIFGKNSDKLEKLSSDNISDGSHDDKMRKALQIIHDQIISVMSGQPSDVQKVFEQLRTIFSDEEFTDGELLEFIDDATEIRQKYYQVVECMARIEYAKRTLQHGFSPKQALILTSSEYMKLPAFILQPSGNEVKFNGMISDIGCGVMWKDRLKYLFALHTYFGEGQPAALGTFKNFPNRVSNYIRLLEENDKFCKEYFKHVTYSIAQEFYLREVDSKTIKNIFQISDDEFKNFVLPFDIR